MRTVSFISANYVARALNYKGPEDWMPNNDATIKAASAEHFLAVVQDVVAAGFQGSDILSPDGLWEDPVSSEYRGRVQGVASRFGPRIRGPPGRLERQRT